MTFTPASISPTRDLSTITDWRIPTVNTRPESGLVDENATFPLVAWWNPDFNGYELYMLDQSGLRYYRVT